ncbi:hypothetical protein FDF31_11870 [Clostridium sporogenes]|nr:hypothetical protein [Clostridium sporogenes]NFS26304.1 hypothetical protein [Clostridium sporogenes]
MKIEKIEWYENDGIEITWRNEHRNGQIYLELDYYVCKTTNDLLNFLKNIKIYKYVSGELCYLNDYVEYIISYNDWRYDYLQYQLYGTEENNNKINYEIGPISKEFLTLIEINENYDEDICSPKDLVTLKITNINLITGVSIYDKDFLYESDKIAKSVIFDISRKYGVDISMIRFEFGNSNIDDEVIEKQCTLETSYDKDLIEYYCKANQMDLSEFQYLAFYRVIGCIFDEVYKYETIEDLKYIINSHSFSSYNNEDITNIINTVEKHQKQKNDREKIKLVFERYLKGEVRDETYYLVNKDLIKILKENLKLIKDKGELKDFQKIGNIVCDFRCKCTHSNRAFNARGNFDGGINELEQYINLIKKICQRIIVTYNVSNIKNKS